MNDNLISYLARRIALTAIGCFILSFGYGQERFYSFVEGWINSYSAETDTSYVLIGLSSSQGIGLFEHRFNVISHEGDSITTKTYAIDSLQTTGCLAVSSIGQLINDEIILSGYAGNQSDDRFYGALFSYTLDGEGNEFAFYDEDQVNSLYNIVSSNDSTLLISSRVSDFGASRRMFLYNTDMQGLERWSFSTNCGASCISSPEQILPLSDGNIALLFYEYDGSLPSFEETLRSCILKLNSEGEELWRRYPGDWEGHHINPGGIVELDGEILVSYSDPYFYNDIDQWDFNDSGSVHLARYDLDGNFISEIDYMNDMYNNLDSARVLYDVSQMQLLDDGNILISGSTGPGGLMMKIDPNGDLLWFRELLWHPLETEGGFSQDTWLYHVLPTSDGGFLGTGEFRHQPTIDYPFSIQTAIALKVDEFGCLEPGCHLVDDIEEFGPLTGSGTSPLRVWPNPANDQLFIELPSRLSLDVRNGGRAGVEVEVIDAFGRVVAVLGTEFFDSGSWEDGTIHFDLNNLASGLNTVRLISPEGVYSAKFIKE